MIDEDNKEESKVKIEPLPMKEPTQRKTKGRPKKYEEGAVERRKKTEDKITLTDKRKKALKKLHVMNAMRNEEKRKAKMEKLEKAEKLLKQIEESENKMEVQYLEEKIQVESKKKQGKSNNIDFYRSPIDNEEDLNPSAVRYNTPIEVPDKVPVVQNDTSKTQPFGTKGRIKVDNVYGNEASVINQRSNELKRGSVPYTDTRNVVDYMNGSSVFPSSRSGFETKTSTNKHQYVNHNQHPFSTNKSHSTGWQHPPKVSHEPIYPSMPKPHYAYNPFHQFQH